MTEYEKIILKLLLSQDHLLKGGMDYLDVCLYCGAILHDHRTSKKGEHFPDCAWERGWKLLENENKDK